MSFHSRKLFLSKTFSALSDAYFNYVTLLLHGNGEISGNNQRFIDNSLMNNDLSATGRTSQGSMSPYNVNWSNYFEGNSILTTPSNPAFSMGTGDFTVEAWIYITEAIVGDFSIFSTRTNTAGDSTQFVLSIGVNQKLRYSSLATQDSSSVVELNKWVHVACVRTSGSVSLFINGQLETTFVDASDKTKQVASIGANCIISGSVNNGMRGYISNLRVVKSSLYTSNFTPSTINLTAIAGTSLLTCQSNRRIDNSVNDFTLASGGSVTAFVRQFSPFEQPTEYSIINNGGSVSFLTPELAGKLSLSSASGRFNFVSGTFTIEFWIYLKKYSGAESTIISSIKTTSGWSIGVTSQGIIVKLNGLSTINMNYAISFGQWNHVAVSGVTGSYSLFINGKQRATYSGATNLASSFVVQIGADSNPTARRLYDADISNVRITQTQVYNADFSVPTFPVSSTGNGGALPSTIPPYSSSAIPLLLNFTNGQIFDNSTKNNLTTINFARIDNSIKKFGTGSIRFVTYDSKLNVYDKDSGTSVTGSPLYYGAGDFTIECWYYLVTISGGYIITHNFGASISLAIKINTNNKIELVVQNSVLGTSANPVLSNSWMHIALVRSGSGLTVFVNGTSVIIASTSATTLGSNLHTTINGILPDSNASGNICYIDDFRITKGIARYLTNFSPPTTQFPDL